MLHSEISFKRSLSFKKILHQLLTKYENKDYDSVIKLAAENKKILEGSVVALNFLACSYIKLNLNKDAILNLKSALKLDSSFQDSYTNMSKVLYQLGNIDESNKMLEKANYCNLLKKKNVERITERISLKEVTDGDFETIKLLFDIGDWWEARNSIESYVKNIGNNALLKSLYGFCLFKTGLSKEGINLLINVLENDFDTDLIAETLLIIALLEDRQFLKAQKYILEKKLDTKPNTIFKEILGILNIFLNDYSIALDLITQINDKQIDSNYHNLFKVLILFLGEQFDQALSILNKLDHSKLIHKRNFGIEIISKNAFVYLIVKILKMNIWKIKNVKLPIILDFLGQYLISLKEIDLAIETFEKSQKIISSDSKNQKLAELYFIKSDWEKAIKHVKIILKNKNTITNDKKELREILSKSLLNLHKIKINMEKLDPFQTNKSVIDQNKLMTHFCPGICVFFTADLYGGGIRLENDYIKFVKERYGQVESLFEWCAGPGFLGYSMLANEITKKLCLADINPKAVKYANKTHKENMLGKDVSIYLSDNMDEVPKHEKFDLVIGNPPHFGGNKDFFSGIDRKGWDEDWKIHEKFFSQIGSYLKPNGRLCIMEWENPSVIGSSTKNTFSQMIEENGLVIEETIDCKLVPDHYYLIVKKSN